MLELLANAISPALRTARAAAYDVSGTITSFRATSLMAAGQASAGSGGAYSAEALREGRALAIARAAAAVALVGTFIVPTLTNVAAVVLLVSFAALPSARRRLRSVATLPLTRAALVLLGVLALATLWSEAEPLLRFRAWWDWRPLVLMIVCLAVFDEPGARRRVLLAFVVIATLGAVYSWWAWSVGVSTVQNNHGMSGIVLRNPVTQAMAFAAAGFLALALAVTQRDFGWRLRICLTVAGVLLLANLLFVTSGRSGHLLLLVMAVVTAIHWLRGGRRVAAIAALVVCAALALSVSPMLQNRFGLLVQELRAPPGSLDSSIGYRLVIWKVSLHMLRERPILGYGMGDFGSAYARAVQETAFTGWAAKPTKDPHNQYLQVQLQAGVAGSVALLWFLVAALRQRTALPQRAWASAILLGWCAGGLFSSMFTTFAEGHLLFLLMGILLAPEQAQSAAGPGPARPGRGRRPFAASPPAASH